MEAYIASQQHQGWICVPERYNDGGFSGGNLDRPALKRLLQDITAGKIDAVLVYKIDRLSRSLLDLARIMKIFEKYHVAFAFDESFRDLFESTQPQRVGRDGEVDFSD